ncbi:ricin B lectin [Streptomyces davaonensis JCM 4913]|uniref:Ricin B lectin n=1 Tax=Streptomyces davaonensis (strain DSM 101723 / JCM 4913 / KCC S-0913 / 768) TaxID=1214101 RepID=K4R1F3_STRDJ|nr:ricin B lectin [Streptomyces davaonensis JCM 4913]
MLMAASLSAVAGLSTPAAAHDIVPEDFSEVTLAKGGGELGEPIAMEVLPDLSVVHTARDGKLRRTDKSGNTSVIGSLPVYTHDEEGLQGVGVDPGFASNRRIYLYYAPASENVNRLSRFTLKSDYTLDMTSEVKILDVASTRGICCHVGGDIDFDSAGNLYLSTGDDTNPFATGYAPLDEQPGREAYDAQRTSANSNDLRGKILRIKVDDNGSYSIPQGNLFAPGTAKTRPEIYAMGLRNPYRMNIDKQTGAIYVGDYGPDGGPTDPNRGPSGQVEFNRITSPGNYGWPYCTGTNTTAETYNDWNFATNTTGPKYDCADGPTNNSPNNTGLAKLPPAKPSWIRYGGDAGSPPEFGGGGEAPMAGPVYRYDAGNPSTTKFPQSLSEHFFAGEFARGWIKAVHVTSGGGVGEISTFKDSPSDNVNQVMDVEFGPDGALYVLDYGTGGNFEPNENSRLLRYDYVGSGGNHAPVAEAAANPQYGHAPLAVNFSSAGSKDPDGDAISFSWAFGDGQTSTEANPSHTYTANGTYKATLTVRDSNGATATADVVIGVGNTPPTVTVSQPLDGQLVSYGDIIPFQFTATDAEDGSSPDCNRASMTNLVRHDTPPTTHTHQLTSAKGCSGWIEAQDSNEGDAARLFPVFDAAYTDSKALPGGKRVTTQLRKRQAEHYDKSSGVRPYDKTAAEGGQTVGDIDNGDWISFAPYRLEKVKSFTARVSSGGVGGTLQIRAGSPTGPVLGSAAVANTGSWESFKTVTGTVSGAAAETTTLYLTFSGGSGKLFDVDSFSFTTAGPVVGLGGKCLDVEGGKSEDGTEVQIYDCNNTGAQTWQREGQTLRALGKCLDVSGASKDNGAKVQLYQCNDTVAQKWEQRADGSLVNPNSGKCLDVEGVNSANGTRTQLWTCGGGANQKWKVLT